MTAHQHKTFLAAARRLGLPCKDERDAVHELSHWLDLETAVPLERDDIHWGLVESGRANMFRSEALARAVEKLLAERNGTTYDLAHWLMVSAIEAVCDGEVCFTPEQRGTVVAKLRAEAVLQLARLDGLREKGGGACHTMI